jgi:hypothetical protein
MNSFAFWYAKPFNPRRPVRRTRRGTHVVTIRYDGSFSRTAVKALIVLAFLAVLSNIIG